MKTKYLFILFLSSFSINFMSDQPSPPSSGDDDDDAPSIRVNQEVKEITEFMDTTVDPATRTASTLGHITKWNNTRKAIQTGAEGALEGVEQCIACGIAGAYDKTSVEGAINDQTLTEAAARMGNMEALQLLLESRINPGHKTMQRALVAAVGIEQHPAVIALMKAKVSPHNTTNDRSAFARLLDDAERDHDYAAKPSDVLQAAALLAKQFKAPEATTTVIEAPSRSELAQKAALTVAASSWNWACAATSWTLQTTGRATTALGGYARRKMRPQRPAICDAQQWQLPPGVTLALHQESGAIMFVRNGQPDTPLKELKQLTDGSAAGDNHDDSNSDE